VKGQKKRIGWFPADYVTPFSKPTTAIPTTHIVSLSTYFYFIVNFVNDLIHWCSLFAYFVALYS